MKCTEIVNNNPSILPQSLLHKNQFHFCYIIGKGGFGKVWKVQYKSTKQTFALKEMSKLKIIDKKSEKSINSERQFLSILNHPFIVNMHYAFQDNDNLYLVMDFFSGGDLRYHLFRYRRFSEEQTRFFLACIVLALDYIHKNNVIHRDIKPENLVLDNKGYLSLTDFGIAKENKEDNSSETSGTPGYMSPEVMKAKNHSFPVDFFAVGVIGYEFMMGKRPYHGNGRKEIKEHMLSTQVQIKDSEIQLGWSPESVDFINRLLLRKPEERLGIVGGAKELMTHPWMKYYPWRELEKRILYAPFIPDNQDNFEKKYCEKNDKITEETKYRYEKILMKDKFKTAFITFYYNIDEVNQMKQKERDKEIEIERQREREREKQKKRRDNNKPQLIQQAITTRTTVDMNATQLIMTTNMKNNLCTNNSNNKHNQHNHKDKGIIPQLIRKQASMDLIRTRSSIDSNTNKNDMNIINNQHREINRLLKKKMGIAYSNNSLNDSSNINNFSVKTKKESLLKKINVNFVSRMANKPYYSKLPFNESYVCKSLIRSSSVFDMSDNNNQSVPPLIQINSVKARECNSFNNNLHNIAKGTSYHQLQVKNNNISINQFNTNNKNSNAINALSKSSSDCMLLKVVPSSIKVN